MKSFTSFVLGVCLLAVLNADSIQSYSFIDYQGLSDSDGGGAISTVMNDQCLNVNGNSIATAAIVDISGCFIVYADNDCAGQSEDLDSVQKAYEITHFNSYKSVTCPESV